MAILAICVIGIVAIAWYQSRPQQHPGWTKYWVEYDFTKNGNHTQIQTSYSSGAVTTEQVNWLNFDNKTAVYNYFRCTPSMPGCTIEDCAFTVLINSVTEYRVRVDCKPET